MAILFLLWESIVPKQVVISKNTNEFDITDRNRKNKHIMFDNYIRRWVVELNEDNFRVVSFSPTIFPSELPDDPDRTRFAVTFICEDNSLQGRSRLP